MWVSQNGLSITVLTEKSYPDYDHSLLALSSSLLQAMDYPIQHNPLKTLDKARLKDARHLVLLVLDGWGWDFFQQWKHTMDLPPETREQWIYSVFPSTTSAALTSLYTAESPYEHGYLGWSLYLNDQDCFFNVLPGTMQGRGFPEKDQAQAIYDSLPVRSIFQKVQDRGDRRSCFLVSPQAFRQSFYSNMVSKGAQAVHYRRDRDFARAVFSPVKKHSHGRTFSMAYHENPDKMLHKCGTRSNWAAGYHRELGHLLCKLASRFRGTDTVLLVTADHGLTDMDSYLEINEVQELMDLLVHPPFPESRFSSFWVKDGQEELFKERFESLMGQDYILLTREEFLTEEWLGPGKAHPRMESYLGQFLAIAKGRRGIKYYGSDKAKKRKPGQYKAHHAGITSEEIRVPLLVMDFPE